MGQIYVAPQGQTLSAAFLHELENAFPAPEISLPINNEKLAWQAGARSVIEWIKHKCAIKGTDTKFDNRDPNL